jgi:hypothetical protein
MYDKYITAIKNNLNLNPDEWYFKSDDDYRSVLEHVSIEKGYEYLHVIQNEFPDIYNNNKMLLIELCHMNDSYGKAFKHTFEDFCLCSPTSLRYIYHSLLNLKYIKELNIQDVNIIEIGGGYGGLCFFINMLSVLFKITIKTYHIFDLEEAIMLQKIYLNKLRINNFTNSTLHNVEEIHKNSYLISNYCFSEIDWNIQNEYIEKIIIKYVSQGMLVWNHIHTYQFVDKPLKIEQERPLTNYAGLSIENKFVYF